MEVHHAVKDTDIFQNLFVRGCFRIEKHTGAQAHAPVVAGKHVEVHATLAPAPERFVGGELGKGYRLVPQVGVEFHHGQRSGNAEYLRIRETFARQIERRMFDLLGQARHAEFRHHDQSRGGHVFFMFPRFDIAEACKPPIPGKGDDGLAVLHLVFDVFRFAFGDTRSARIGGRFDRLTNNGSILQMFLRCHENIDILYVHSIRDIKKLNFVFDNPPGNENFVHDLHSRFLSRPTRCSEGIKSYQPLR